nr:ALPV-221 [Albatrosspox virus]
MISLISPASKRGCILSRSLRTVSYNIKQIIIS